MAKQHQYPTYLNVTGKSSFQNSESSLEKHEIKLKTRRQKIEELNRHRNAYIYVCVCVRMVYIIYYM